MKTTHDLVGRAVTGGLPEAERVEHVLDGHRRRLYAAAASSELQNLTLQSQLRVAGR